MKTRYLMVQGTSSSAGKSLLVTALCHAFARRGLRVTPFKAQNMSNNAAVCPDGSEIGRAQATQAAAAGIEPSAAMNPILIKPEADSRSQVIVNGRPWRTLDAGQYYQHKDYLWQTVTHALDNLSREYELVIMEGAGSPAELNLKSGDLVNMAVARHTQAPVLLVGDIDRGGIFAQLLGTLWLLPDDERSLVRGLVVNKFRGDIALFADGVRILEARGGVSVLGVVPYIHNLDLPEEDAVAIERPQSAIEQNASGVDIAILRLPRIANFDDFDPLAAEPGVNVRFVDSPANLGEPHAIILPGSKSTTADLHWLRQQKFAPAIEHHRASGGALVGICGGYQMLGQAIHDPQQVESAQSEMRGLGMLEINTIFNQDKATHRVQASVLDAPGWMGKLHDQLIHGYEIHMGTTRSAHPWLQITQRNHQPADGFDGAISADGRVWGCYLHGIFENASFRHAWLSSLGWSGVTTEIRSDEHRLLHSLERLTDTIEAAMDMPRLEALIWED